MDTATTNESAFESAFAFTVGEEGGYTADPADPGNWTGGAVGQGRCAGTRWGIAAASYPGLDIRNLSREAARDLYRRDYWAPARCGEMPGALATLVFDAAVNNGVRRSIMWLQAALGVVADGEAGPATMGALTRAASDLPALCCEFQARRISFMGGLSGWSRYGLGWARRLCRSLIAASARATNPL